MLKKIFCQKTKSQRACLPAKQGFTLIELLIVIAIIAIVAAVVFVALDPLTRFRDARDASRWTDISAVLSAIKVHQVDNGGFYLTEVSDMTAGAWYMIVDGAMALGCDDNNANCDVVIGGDTNCVDLSGLVTAGYLAYVPVSPPGPVVTWDSGSADGQKGTGYALKRDDTGILHVQACESENAPSISVSR